LVGLQVTDIAFEEVRAGLLGQCLRGRSSMSTKPTFEPCAAKCSTIDAPMPEPPPEMKTERSFRLGKEATTA